MNRSIRLIAALGMLALPSALSAQSITGSISASADIATVFSFGVPSPLNFGSITPGTAASASGYIPLSRNIGVIYSLPDGANTGLLTGPSATTVPFGWALLTTFLNEPVVSLPSGVFGPAPRRR